MAKKRQRRRKPLERAVEVAIYRLMRDFDPYEVSNAVHAELARQKHVRRIRAAAPKQKREQQLYLKIDDFEKCEHCGAWEDFPERIVSHETGQGLDVCRRCCIEHHGLAVPVDASRLVIDLLYFALSEASSIVSQIWDNHFLRDAMRRGVPHDICRSFALVILEDEFLLKDFFSILKPKKERLSAAEQSDLEYVVLEQLEYFKRYVPGARLHQPDQAE